MIAAVNGEVLAIGDDRLDVSIGPVALSVHVPSPVALAARIGQPVALSTTMVVREDAITLYGFADAVSRDDFLTLTSVSGIGPRLALAILSALPPANLRAAIGSGNLAALTAVSGVGKKSAERLVIELRDRLGPAPAGSVPAEGTTTAEPWQDQVRTALLGLGWNPRDAQTAIDTVATMAFDDGGNAAEQPLQALLRAALRSLDRS
ncbi:MAG: Holliday junction branch migration protein RuvA [Actinomycetales bacterium]|nr:Holliday junction branch migration protein RuvA [Actinomycetales bacterium]